MPGAGGKVKLTAKQIGEYATAAGFTGNDVKIAVAVALAESGGNPTAHNAVPPDNSYGLWQINMLGSMGPDRRKRFGLAKNEELFEPSKNAKAAYSIWKDSGWKAWTTYTRGTYKKYLAEGTEIDTDPGSGSEVPVSTSGGDGIAGAITGAANAVSLSLFKGAANIGGILLAITLVIMGIVLLAREPLMKIVPMGKVGKIAKGLK